VHAATAVPVAVVHVVHAVVLTVSIVNTRYFNA
jgi:hypothetical protein